VGKRIEKTLVLTIALSYLISPYSASAGFFDWPVLKNGFLVQSDKLLVQPLEDNRNSFEKIYAWTPAVEVNGDFQSQIKDKEKLEWKVIKTYDVRATAYSSTPDQTDDTPFITASGTSVRDGIIAANFLPFGTQLRIPEIYGEKVFTVEDRMNKRYWHHVDIWFPERSLAKAFGAQHVTIEIVEES